MRLSKTSEYAIRVLCFMAKKEDPPYSATLINKELNIPYKYLTKILTLIAKAGLIKSIKGRDGGFYLGKDPSSITLYDIVHGVEDNCDEQSCVLGFGSCNKDIPCFMHEEWETPKEKIYDMLTKTTLKSFTQKEISKF